MIQQTYFLQHFYIHFCYNHDSHSMLNKEQDNRYLFVYQWKALCELLCTLSTLYRIPEKFQNLIDKCLLNFVLKRIKFGSKVIFKNIIQVIDMIYFQTFKHINTSYESVNYPVR